MSDYTQSSLYARAYDEAIAQLPPAPQSVPIKMHVHDSLLTRHPHYPEVLVPESNILAVYVLQMGPYFKIGYTIRPAKRIPQIHGGLPVRPIPILIIPVPYAAELEFFLHYKFASIRSSGEWFCLTLADINYLRALQAAVPLQVYDSWMWDQMDKTARRSAVKDMCEDLVPYMR